jgi:hypothetical protein
MIKVFFKVSILLIGLFMVITASRYFASDDFKGSIDGLFNVQGRPFQWCRADKEKFRWLDESVASKYSSWTEGQLAQKYCLLQLESITGVDLKQVKWVPLAESVDADGKPTVLEWDRHLVVFRVAGLPFKSSFLYYDLTK